MTTRLRVYLDNWTWNIFCLPLSPVAKSGSLIWKPASLWIKIFFDTVKWRNDKLGEIARNSDLSRQHPRHVYFYQIVKIFTWEIPNCQLWWTSFYVCKWALRVSFSLIKLRSCYDLIWLNKTNYNKEEFSEGKDCRWLKVKWTN